MPEIHSALERTYRVGRPGGDREPGVRLRELVGWDLVQVAAWHDRVAALSERVATALGVAPPEAPNRCRAAEAVEVMSVAPQRYWCIAPADDPRLAGLAAAVDTDTGAVTELGHSQTRVRVEGPAARRLLAQEVALDLDARAFPEGTLARTAFHHVPVLVLCVDADAGVFDLLIARSFAASTWEYLLDLGEAPGCEIGERTAWASVAPGAGHG